MCYQDLVLSPVECARQVSVGSRAPDSVRGRYTDGAYSLYKKCRKPLVLPLLRPVFSGIHKQLNLDNRAPRPKDGVTVRLWAYVGCGAQYKVV